MASVAREKLTHETLRDAGCVTQLAMATACGMGFGLFGALCTFTMAYPTLSECLLPTPRVAARAAASPRGRPARARL